MAEQTSLCRQNKLEGTQTYARAPPVSDAALKSKRSWPETSPVTALCLRLPAAFMSAATVLQLAPKPDWIFFFLSNVEICKKWFHLISSSVMEGFVMTSDSNVCIWFLQQRFHNSGFERLGANSDSKGYVNNFLDRGLRYCWKSFHTGGGGGGIRLRQVTSHKVLRFFSYDVNGCLRCLTWKMWWLGRHRAIIGYWQLYKFFVSSPYCDVC